MPTSIDKEALKRVVVELLRSDWEFRRAVAAELGLLEILERMDRLEERMVKLEERMVALEERMMKLEEEIRKLWEKVEEHTKAIRELQEQVVKLWEAVHSLRERMDRFEDKLNALGARWGLMAEEAVRASLYRVLREYLGVARVEKWEEYDGEGRVFGRPALIEIDVVVRDDTHYLIEVKSSVDMYDVYVFNRKCDLYIEKVKPPKVKKLIVTFYPDEKAKKAAKELGIEIVQG